MFVDSKNNKALLRYEFFGANTNAKSLRDFIQKCDSATTVEKTIRRLYQKRLATYHPLKTGRKAGIRSLKLNKTLDWWTDNIDLDAVANEIGKRSLESYLRGRFKTTLTDMKKEIKRIGSMPEKVRVGTAHGDLHTENVLIDDKGRLELIDFAWTSKKKWKAVDFLMMECSLKFSTTPQNATLEDLISLEAALDKGIKTKSKLPYKELEASLYGKELSKIARAVHVVREEALKRKVTTDLVQYKKGLVLLSAGLANVKQVLNRMYIFASLGYQLRWLDLIQHD
jgi:tRNA A-37 threonylcarbamoyl transferase component Bud32